MPGEESPDICGAALNVGSQGRKPAGAYGARRATAAVRTAMQGALRNEVLHCQSPHEPHIDATWIWGFLQALFNHYGAADETHVSGQCRLPRRHHPAHSSEHCGQAWLWDTSLSRYSKNSPPPIHTAEAPSLDPTATVGHRHSRA